MNGDIEYVGLVAEAWDALRGDTSTWEDRFFYHDVLRERGTPALDVGCGTGRLLLEFLAQGFDVDGVDNSPEMLAICRRNAAEHGLDPRLYEQRMEELDLPRRYRTILVPSSSLQLVLDPDDALEALRGFRRHLEPGGTLALPFIVMDRPYDNRYTREATLPNGDLVRRTARETFDPAVGIEATDDLFEVFRDGALVRSERHVRPRATRAWSRDEVHAALDAVGFTELEWLSNFTREPMNSDDEIFTVLARRPA